MLRFSCVFVLASILTAPAACQGLGQFPAARTYHDQFLRRPFRLPLGSLLEVNSPAELVRVSLSPTPRFASAPVASIESNPFGDATSLSAAELSEREPASGFSVEADGASEALSDPFGGVGEEGDPFAGSPAPSTDPFAAGSNDADPFGDPGPDADKADPFADSGDDPFGF